MTVYADVLFLVNFSLDFVTLYITGRLMSHSSSALGMSAAAGLGASFAVAALVFDMEGAGYVLALAAVTFLMCVCAYRRAGLFGYAISSVLLFSVGSALGGAISAICSIGSGYRDSMTSDPAEDAVMLAVAGAATLATAASVRAAKHRVGAVRRSVTVTVDGESVELDALADSGSFIKDPLSGTPVLIVRADALRSILPLSILSAVPSCDITSLPSTEMVRVRVIPISGVAGEGIVLGYRPDSVLVEGKNGKKTEKSCILGLSDGKNGFGGCDAILPSDFI